MHRAVYFIRFLHKSSSWPSMIDHVVLWYSHVMLAVLSYDNHVMFAVYHLIIMWSHCTCDSHDFLQSYHLTIIWYSQYLSLHFHHPFWFQNFLIKKLNFIYLQLINIPFHSKLENHIYSIYSSCIILVYIHVTMVTDYPMLSVFSVIVLQPSLNMMPIPD